MKNNLFLPFCLLAIISFSNFTQNLTLVSEKITITGKVTDESGTPLIGASILQADTENGTVSNLDGIYEFTVPREVEIILECSYTGYTTQKQVLKLEDKTNLVCNFKLVATATLSEVVVIGYGVPLIEKDNTTSDRAYPNSGIKKITEKVPGIALSSGTEGKKKKSKKKKASSGKSAPKIFDVAPSSSIYMEEEAVPVSIISYDSDDFVKTEGKESSKPSVISTSNLSASTLTAGEVHDFSKWELWNDLSEEDLNHWKKHWNFNLTNRYSVQVMTDEGFPAIDAKVELKKGKEIVWSSRTDNTGKAELWSHIFVESGKTKEILTAEISYKGKTKTIHKLTKFQEGMNFIHLDKDCEIPEILDVLFVLDATSSMRDEMQYLQAEIYDVIERVQDMRKDMTINLGSVFYRDEGDEYVTRKQDLTGEFEQTVNFMKAQNARGGGDYPEAVESALDVAVNEIKWSENTVAKLLFLVLDAPPHHNPEILKKLENLIRIAAQKGIRIIPIASSGINKSTEYLLRSFALSTNGTYVFLTDDSGVGNPHIEPSTDEYSVEKLNDLLIRVIRQFTEVTSCQNQNLAIDDLKIDPKNDKPNSKKDKNQIKVFPNPTTGAFTVDLKKSVQELFITDLSGKILFRLENVKKGETKVSLDNYPSGMYFVRFMEGEKAVTEKVILQREVGSVVGK